LLPGPVAKIIEKERPDVLLPTLGGQTALNLAMALHEDGTLERLGVELIGADHKAIRRAEGRIALPAIVRPAFTLGGQGGGVGETDTELRQVVSEGLAASPINQVLVE